MGNKTLAALSLWLFGFSAVYSQEIPIQLMLVDNAGFEKVNHNVKLRLTMSNDTSSTLGQYQEVHLTQSNEYGIISENIGSGVATTNSQVLSLEQFTFLTNEPIIKVELDTSSVSNQYYTVGFLPYSYPMVARRALSADSSDYSDQSMNSEYSDTAEFARNFNESFDGDTSDMNELQVLSFNSESKILSISNGNQVSIGNGNKTQVVSTLIEVSNSFNANQWMAADSVYLYGRSGSNGSNIIKALITRPDSIISTTNVSFSISRIFPTDSLVLSSVGGTGSNMTISSCDLNGANNKSVSISKNSGSDNIITSWSSVNNGIVSLYVNRNNSSYDNLYSWDVQSSSSTLSNVQIYGDIGRFNDYIIEKFYSSQGYDGRGSGNYIRTRNRWTNSVFNTRQKYNSLNYVPVGIDKTGEKYIERYSNSGYYYLKDSTGSNGSFQLFGSSPNIIENTSGYYLAYSSLPNSSSGFGLQQLYLLNVNNINTSKPVLNLILENWRNHAEADGYLQWINGHNEFLLLFSNSKNLWINDTYRNGNFIIRVPYEE